MQILIIKSILLKNTREENSYDWLEIKTTIFNLHTKYNKNIKKLIKPEVFCVLTKVLIIIPPVNIFLYLILFSLNMYIYEFF